VKKSQLQQLDFSANWKFGHFTKQSYKDIEPKL